MLPNLTSLLCWGMPGSQTRTGHRKCVVFPWGLGRMFMHRGVREGPVYLQLKIIRGTLLAPFLHGTLGMSQSLFQVRPPCSSYFSSTLLEDAQDIYSLHSPLAPVYAHSSVCPENNPDIAETFAQWLGLDLNMTLSISTSKVNSPCRQADDEDYYKFNVPSWAILGAEGAFIPSLSPSLFPPTCTLKTLLCRYLDVTAVPSQVRGKRFFFRIPHAQTHSLSLAPFSHPFST